MDTHNLQAIAEGFLTRLDVGWTFMLLMTRYLAFLMLIPGLGGGITGMALRYPASLVLAFVSFDEKHMAVIPPDLVVLSCQIVSEVVLGAAIGLIPLLVVSGAQTAGHLASGTMGLNGAQLFDPSTNTPLSDLSRFYSDFAIVVFLLMGGHYMAISALSGLNTEITPGTFMFSPAGLEAFMVQTGRIFQIGCLIAAPVVVALLLTNFVLGLISKAVPTVNIFVISFPLTIGVGFVISLLALPEVAYFLGREFNRFPDLLSAILG